jgi:adenosylmethionine-8-amino-7-oxononanoate aminotransferase
MTKQRENPDWYREGYPHIWLPYTQMQTAPDALPVASTEDVRIRLESGEELIDGIASWWTACHGYNHPHIQNMMIEQIKAMPHVMLGGLVHEPALRLAKRLADLLPGDLNHVFFSESGSVSVEIAMKMAVQYWLNQGVKGRTHFVSFHAGYHGDTSAAMSVSDPEEGMHKQFAGYLAEQFVVDFPRDAKELEAFDALLADKGPKIAAVMVEPLIQGAGGMKFHTPEQLAAMAGLCKKHDILLIADEIFTGFGRTGTLFACEQAGIVPDIICLGKALTGGVAPMAATVATGRVYNAFLSDDPDKALMHGPTFMANPITCAAALASLDLFEQEPRLEQVKRIEGHLGQSLEQFRGLPGVVDVRVKGAVGVIQLDSLGDVGWLKERFRAEGVWMRPFGDIIYVTPAFTINSKDLAQLTHAIGAVLQERPWASGTTLD